jgi:hypothetical protein
VREAVEGVQVGDPQARVLYQRRAVLLLFRKIEVQLVCFF